MDVPSLDFDRSAVLSWALQFSNLLDFEDDPGAVARIPVSALACLVVSFGVLLAVTFAPGPRLARGPRARCRRADAWTAYGSVCALCCPSVVASSTPRSTPVKLV